MSFEPLAVAVRGLSKAYRIDRPERHSTLAETVLARLRRPFHRRPRDVFWALREVSFEVHRGEVVGIVGRNGAGKSTLLKILSRITEPTDGEADLYGRTGSLLEVGTGFHRELTGRENIYLNGGILGMTRREIQRRFDEIVDFAGVERFLDTPVKRYSSGMYVRLAFAVAAHLQPEILIVDEVLAVGDAQFQRKCLGKMSDVAKGGRTVLFVSHSPAAIQSLCSRCVWLEEGRIRRIGPTTEVLEAYLDGATAGVAEADLFEHRGRPGSIQKVLLERLRFVNADGELTPSIHTGETLRVQMLVNGGEGLTRLSAGVGVSDRRGQRVFTVQTRYAGAELPLVRGRAWIECEIPQIMLAPGLYQVKVAISSGGQPLDEVENAASFEVLPRDVFGVGVIPAASQGAVVQPSVWRLADQETIAVSAKRRS